MKYGKKMGLVMLFAEEHLSAEKHLEQLRRDEADMNCDPVYCNAAFLGVFPCFVPVLVPEGTCYQYKFSDDVQNLVDNMDFEARRTLTGHMLKLEANSHEELEMLQCYFPALPALPAPPRLMPEVEKLTEHHKAEHQQLKALDAELKDLGYSLDDLEQSNPYNAWMHEG